MPWTKLVVCSASLVLLGCEKLPVLDWTNPLDLEEAERDSVVLPALVFFPDTVSVDSGATVGFQVFAMEVDSLGGSFIQVQYDTGMVAFDSAGPGEFFDSALVAPLFFFQDDTALGILDFYTINLGTDTLAGAVGTGSLVYFQLEVVSPGHSRVEFTEASQLVDPDDNPIEIGTYFYGAIHAE